MNKLSLSIAAAAAAFALPAAAQAQTVTGPQAYAGITGGYHDLGAGNSLADDNGAIIGGVAGVDFPVGETLTLGVEGNYAFGTSAIDREYGVAAKLGFPIGTGSQLFVKGGWQWVDLDLSKATGVPGPFPGVDDTVDDYVVGVGAELGQGFAGGKLRVGVDTISFDSVRATAGLIFKF